MVSPDSPWIVRPADGCRRAILAGLCLLLGLGLGGCGDPNKAFNVSSALRQASKTNQIVLVEFWGFNDACSRMDEKVLSHPLVRRDLEDFVRVRMNYAMSRDTARNLAVTGAPGFAALRPDGSVIAASTGELGTDTLRQFLVRAKIFR